MATAATAPAPMRSTASVVVSFGLINLQLSLYATTTETRVARKEFTREGNPIGRQAFDKVTGDVVDRADVVKMVEVGDALVELTDDEVAAATGHTSGIAPIIGRVPLADLDRMTVEKTYQVRPKRDNKAGAANERAFALLTTTLAAAEEAAMVRISVRGSIAKWAVITPDGRLRIVHSADQVRQDLPMPAVEVSDAEADLARQLLDAIPTVDIETMTDDSSEKVREYVEAKIAGDAPTVEAPAAPKGDDLMAQLQASIAR